MKSFLEFSRQLDERQIQYGNNANYGQVVFFAGGAASGKGFSIANFIDSSKFKIRDVDALKLMFLKLPSMLAKYPEMRDFNLKTPENVFALHQIVKKEGVPEKQFAAMLSGMKSPDTLPNLLFDATLKDMGDLHHFVPALISVGYRPENFHITWILTDYSVAIVRNRERTRVVPEDIMLATHSGAALTMKNILNGALPKTINGSITVILNNPDAVTFYPQSHSTKDGKKVKLNLVKDFTYITLKKAGRPMPAFVEMDSQIRQTLVAWVLANAPKLAEIERAYSN